MEHFSDKIGGWFNFAELYSRMVKESNDVAHFVEIGAWEGKSTCYMGVEIANSGKKIKFDVIDTWLGSSEHKEFEIIKENKLYDCFLQNIEPIKHIVNPIRLTSKEASMLYEDDTLDFVFIDAAHEYEMVKLDINSWLPKVKKGGYIGGDDYSFGDVNRAVTEILDIDKIEKIGIYPSWLYRKE